MKRSQTLHTVLHLSGFLIIALGVLLLLPLIVALIFGEREMFWVFILSSLLSFLVGFLLWKLTRPGQLYFLQSMLVCGLAWSVLSFFGCLPFILGAGLSPLDAYFEAVSGLTATGITIITDIESLPRSILFWRSFMQWMGGLGILTLFLAITFRSNNTYFQLYSAESHKIDSARPTPSIFRTAVILWGIYILFTVSEAALLKLLGLSVFDAICHSLTTLSTGGFSTYDASIDHFRQAGYKHYRAIEYVIAFFMMIGGVNFLLHYKMLRGRLRDAFGNIELRTYVGMILLLTVLIMLNSHRQYEAFRSAADVESGFRHTIFTVIAIFTTTGYGTTSINEPFFPAMSKQVFLMLMLIGGCVGSTSGGFKVLRIVILFKAFAGQIVKLRLPRKALSEVVIDRRIVPDGELRRVIGLFGGWLTLILVGGLITSFFTDLNAWQGFSGMFSAVGNIGPCFFSVQQMSELPAIVKLTYIFGILAGRLEILPVLLLFSRRAWR